MPPAEFATVSLSALAPGIVLSAPIFEPSAPGTKLIGAGIEVDQHLIDQLSSRGVGNIAVSKRDLASVAAGRPQGDRKKSTDHSYPSCDLRTDRSSALEAEIEATDLGCAAQDPGENDPCVARDGSFDAAAVREKIQQREQQVSFVDDLFVKLIEGDGVEVDGLSDLCRESMKSVIDDRDLFLALGLNPFDGDYPSRHSLHVSCVAISIGVALCLDDQSLVDLGTGCLIHDVGMLKLDPRLFRARRKLSQRELRVLAEHPVRTLDALACPGVSLSRVSRIVAFQIHERCDGSGYPRAITGESMHYLSKIAAVADAYVGLVSNRWHRRGLMPYYAMEKMLQEVAQGRFDARAVRGLLHSVSLFPIGSFVETEDGREARVVRSNGVAYTAPKLEFWSHEHQEFIPELVDLNQDSSVKIRRAIPSLSSG